MRLAFPTLMFTAVALLLGAAGVNAAPQHALTVYGEPASTLPASVTSTTPIRRPKGGTMRRSAIEIGHFDHILPYIDKGIGVTQIDGLLYSPLAQRSMDEPYTVYGLVAQADGALGRRSVPALSSSTPRRASPTASRSPPKTYATPTTC
jgi:microcin C transport system substrate-binding protein